MAVYFSDRLQEVIEKIFNSWDKEVAWQGKEELEQIIKEDGADCADAYALLARIHAGPRFVWPEADFPEDIRLTYRYLQVSIRKGSALGLLLGLRISGAMTPSLEKDLPLTVDEAFLRIRQAAEEGSAYCQHVIGNVYYWRDYEKIAAARDKLMVGKNNLLNKLKYKLQQTLTGHSQKIQPMDIMTQEAAYWLSQSLENGFLTSPDNLRNLYIEVKDYKRAHEVALSAASQGNLSMMALVGRIAADEGDFETAISYFQQGAAKNNQVCLIALGECYYKDRSELEQFFPEDIPLALSYYEKAVTRWEGDTISLVYATKILLRATFAASGHLPQDWGKISCLVNVIFVLNQEEDVWPYVGYMMLHGKGMLQDSAAAVKVLKKAEAESKRREEDDNLLSYYILEEALWRLGLGFAYENGYIDEQVDYDQAVAYYQESSELVERYLEIFGADYRQSKVENEAAQRLAYFEQVDGHWCLRSQPSQSTANALPDTWPQNSHSLFKEDKDSRFKMKTSFFDWEDMMEEFARVGKLALHTFANPLTLDEGATELCRVMLVRDEKDPQRVEVRFYGWEEQRQEEEVDGYKPLRSICYSKEMPEEAALAILKNYYDHASLAGVDVENWEKNYRKPKTPYDYYLLEVDGRRYRLEDYDDSNQMILDSLEGVQSGKYASAFVRTDNYTMSSFFVYPNHKKGQEAYRVNLYLRQTDGKAWLFERLCDSAVSLNYWISDAMSKQHIPDLSDWEELPLPEDGSIPFE